MLNELILLLVLALINSFVIIGWNKAANFDMINPVSASPYIDEDSKMIFWKLRFWSLKTFGEFWSKPLFTCPTCMASVHSTYVYWLIVPFTLHSLILYPVYILMLSGMVTIVNNHT